MSDLVFLEYSYNPAHDEPSKITNRLSSLGYILRSQHVSGLCEVWVQKHSIFLVRKNPTQSKPAGINGIGILTDEHPMDIADCCIYDDDTEFFVYESDDGFRIYFIEDREMTNLYVLVNDSLENKSGISSTSGAILHTVDKDLINNLRMFVKKEEQADEYIKFIFKNNFTLFVKPYVDSRIDKIITETNDVFFTTSYMIANNINLLQFDIDDHLDFGNLTHKIKGYNCKAFGNSSSYSIENFIPAKDFNVDIIFRQRKQYIKINQQTLDFYEKCSIN